ncbi:MAG: mechanosensitive ion channel domain-containing protein, partial [Pleurocapsa sp.]
ERPFTEGDWIEVDGIKGKVTEINWRSVHLLTREIEMLVIPNAALAGATIRNYRRPQKLHIEPVGVGFSYNDPPNKVKRVMKETALSTKGVLDKPEPIIQTISYDDSSIGYIVKLFMSDYDKVPMVRDEFMTRVWYAAERNGLNIPFPIRTLYHNPPTKTNSAEIIDGYRQTLHGFPSFASAGTKVLTDLAQVATERSFGEGEKAIAQGNRTEGLYIIVKGMESVTINQENSIGDEEVAQLIPGDFFGESALSGKEISPVTVTALSDLEIIILPIDAVQVALEESTRLRQEIGVVMETRRKAIFTTQKKKNRSNGNGNGRFSSN